MAYACSPQGLSNCQRAQSELRDDPPPKPPTEWASSGTIVPMKLRIMSLVHHPTQSPGLARNLSNSDNLLIFIKIAMTKNENIFVKVIHTLKEINKLKVLSLFWGIKIYDISSLLPHFTNHPQCETTHRTQNNKLIYFIILIFGFKFQCAIREHTRIIYRIPWQRWEVGREKIIEIWKQSMTSGHHCSPFELSWLMTQGGEKKMSRAQSFLIGAISCANETHSDSL